MNPHPAQPVIDTHVFLRDGDKLLFSQRGGPYGHGRWHMPSGKLGSVERIGFFFEATEWTGDPVNREPAKCLALQWFSVHELPEDIIEYPREGLLGYLEGSGVLAEHGW
ncbi:DNA mismatch repair protein MutT [Streptomyces sp. NPDC058595]|uniref:DNA mismatch repair protein MutT n=1 Tax=Streptomyces sp. NPDC058595 TaxID=3346550 RepID=UPI00365F44A4